MASPLQQRIAQFTAWRDKLVAEIDEFRVWQDTYGQADIEQSLRIYDLVEALRNDRIRLAFMGESAPDKIGLINALLFSDLPGGLLPQEPGCEFLCATEIFHDAAESPYVRVLPIETRKREESIAALRRSPVDWITMRMNADSPASIAEAMRSLMEARPAGDDAKALTPGNGGEAAMIPAWRYALVNLPHPMLKSGLIALYSPGPLMLAADPEVAMRFTTSAQSLLMVLGKDLTAEAHGVWKQFVQNSKAHKFVVRESGSGSGADAEAEAEASVAQTLGIPAANVLSLAIGQAVAARLANTSQAEAGSGIEGLERLHADQLVPERQALLLSAIGREIGPLVQSARQAVAARFIATVREMQDLSATAGKSRNVALDMLARLEAQRTTYQKSVAAFNVTYANLMAQGQELLAALHDDRIEAILTHDQEFIQGAWTTAGMWKSIQGLFSYFGLQVEKILNYAVKLRGEVEVIYQQFHENFGLAKLSPPPLTLAKHLETMHALEANARDFCHDPVNIATYKDFLIKKFYDGLVTEARQTFELTRLDTEHWLRGALVPLNGQIMERQTLMIKRVENLRNMKYNLTSVQERIKQLDQQRQLLKKQGDQIDLLRTNLALNPAPAARSADATHPALPK